MDENEKNEKLFYCICKEIESDIELAAAPFCCQCACNMENYFLMHSYSYETFFYTVLINTLKMLGVIFDNDSSDYVIDKKIDVPEKSIPRLKNEYLNRDKTHKEYMSVNEDTDVKIFAANADFYEFLCNHKNIKNFLNKENFGTLGVSGILSEFYNAYKEIKEEDCECDYYTKVDLLYEIEKNSYIQLVYHMLRGLKSYKKSKRVNDEGIQKCLKQIAELTKSSIVGDSSCWECIKRFFEDKPENFSYNAEMFYKNLIRIYEGGDLINSMQCDTSGIIFGRNKIYDMIEEDFCNINCIKRSLTELNFIRQAVIYAVTDKYFHFDSFSEDAKVEKQKEKCATNRFIEVAHCKKSLAMFEKFYKDYVEKDFGAFDDSSFTHTHFKKLYLMPTRQNKKINK